MNIEIKTMQEEDIEDILVVENNSFSTPWSKEAFMGELINPMAIYLCVHAEGKVIGYAGMWKIYDEGHITNVAILDKYRGRGISKLLMNEMFETAIINNINRMTLEVRQSNIKAINLYSKLGFVEFGKRPGYYKNPVEDAIIMWKELESKVVI